jgi:hypothetical protein
VRLGVVVAVMGGALVLLFIGLAIIGSATGRSRASQSINHEPISLEQAHQLIDNGQVFRIAIRGRQGNVDELCYFLFDPGKDTSCQWKVDGVNVHLFTESMPTGVPILSDDQDAIGLTNAQFEDLFQRVNEYNDTASQPIDVLDQRR